MDRQDLLILGWLIIILMATFGLCSALFMGEQ